MIERVHNHITQELSGGFYRDHRCLLSFHLFKLFCSYGIFSETDAISMWLIKAVGS